jgi:hypothetical protein
MKKILFFAATAAMFFTSCAKDTAGNNVANVETETGLLIVKIPNAPATRALQGQGATELNTIDFVAANSLIFVLDDDTVLDCVQMTDDATSDDGQTLGEFAGTSKVYVVGNVSPTDKSALEDLTTLTAIKEYASKLEDYTNYRTVPLANVGGTATELVPHISAPTPTDNETYLAAVSIAPLVSRLELVSVEAEPLNADNEGITSFTVSNIYVDDTYPQFTYGGTFDGNKHAQGVDRDFTEFPAYYNDVPATPLADGAPLAVSAPEGQAWGYNVAAGSYPRFIIELSEIKWQYLDDDDDMQIKHITEKQYITLKGYAGVSTFQRGVIYRIGTTNNPFKINPELVKDVPNHGDVDVIVSVDIVEWTLSEPEVIM